MSEEVVTTTTEAVNGNPETSTVEEKECNGTNDETKTEDESVIPETSTVDENECNGTKDDEIVGSPSKGSKFVASFKLKAKNAKDGIKDKAEGLKGKMAKFRQKSESSVSNNIHFIVSCSATVITRKNTLYDWFRFFSFLVNF